MSKMLEEVRVVGSMPAEYASVLTPDALRFVADLQTEFGATRESLLAMRSQRQVALDRGQLPDFLSETASVRAGDWRVASCPDDLLNRRVEITGPAEIGRAHV